MKGSKQWRHKLTSVVMLCSLLIPLTTVVGTAAINSAPSATVVFASVNGNSANPNKNGNSNSSDNSHRHHSSGGNGNKNKGGSSVPKSSNGGKTSDVAKGNILDQPASELAQDAAKYMTADNDSDDDSKSSKSDAAADAKKEKTASLKTLINDGSLGSNGAPNIGNAWSFMSSDNDGFWAIGDQSSATYHVTASADSNNSTDHYPSVEGKQAYAAMVEATHLPYIMNELGLDNSFSQGFGYQKHSTFELWGANLMQLFYGLTKFVNDSFDWVLSILADLNPFNLIIQKNLSGLQSQHFGALSAFLGDIYNGGTKFGATLASMLAAFGITLAAMGLQVGQSARTSQGRGMLASGIDLVKRFFVIMALPMILGMAYTDLMNLAKGLFDNSGYAPGNYAVYSTMTSFEDMVNHGRLNFSPSFIAKGILPNEQQQIKSSRVTGAFLNHRSTLAINADFGRSGAQELMDATNGTDDNSTQNMFVADKGAADGQSSAMNMLRDYAANRTYAASDYVSAITPGIPSKNKKLSDQLENNKDAQDPTDLKSKMYSENGNLIAGPTHFTDASGVMGNTTDSSAADLATRQGGLSTIGMYNYLRSVTVLSKIHESSPYKHNNGVSNPQHFSVNFVGSGALRDANILFALALMGSMALIAVGTLWFIIKALIDAIPGSFGGVLQGAFGSLAGGVRAVGAFFGFFIAFGVTGIFYQLSFKSLIAFISAFESFFSANNGSSTGDAMSSGAIKLLGLNGSAPNQVVGAITLNSSEFTAVTVAESLLMIYIVMMLFRWRKALCASMSAAINNSFSRILQSFGAVTGKGSDGMDNTMNKLAEKSGHSGVSNMYNGAKGALGTAGRTMGLLSGGRGSAGKMAKDLMTLGATGLGAGAAMKGLSNLSKDSVKSSSDKSSSLRDRDKRTEASKHSEDHAPKNAEDARQQAVLQDLASRQGEPLDQMADSDIGTATGQQNEMARAAAQNSDNAIPDMNAKYSDQGHLQQLSHSTNNAQNHGNLNGMPTSLSQMAGTTNPMAMSSSKGINQNSNQDALDQVLQAAGDGTHKPGTGINGQHLTPKQQAEQRRLMHQAGQMTGIMSANSNLDNLVDNPNTVDGMQQNTGPAGMQQNTDLAGLQQNAGPLADDGSTDTVGDLSASDQTDNMVDQPLDTLGDSMQDLDTNPVQMADTSPVQMNGQLQPSGAMTHQDAKQLTKGINKLAGTNLSTDQVEKVTPEFGQMLDSGLSSIDNIMDGGPSVSDGTTITATGNGQGVVTDGSQLAGETPGINSDVSYGKGLGVMPGAVPDGMVADPSYTSSGAGVIHGGLNTALSNVQTANANVQRANDAVSVNPGNQILQQRAQNAIAAQRTAQTEAMEAFNSAPARQMMGSLVNSNIPSQVTTGQVNKAVNDVYHQQQVFKQTAFKYGPSAAQTQQAATQYRQALNTAENLHIKSQILHRADFLQAAHESIRNQQMSIMNGTFKPR